LRALQKFVVLLLGLGLSTAAWADDSDGDGVDDTVDNCPFDSNADQADGDCDGRGDVCQPAGEACITCCGSGGPPPVEDWDGDGWEDTADNCPGDANPGQEDEDCDFTGDACDGVVDTGLCDADGDGEPDDTDNCPETTNPTQTDADCDGFGDPCDDDDTDGFCDGDDDGVHDDVDNCVDGANPLQEDSDCDAIGDVCDDIDDDLCVHDGDEDGVEDTADNCPTDANPDQDDVDCDGEGDTCDGNDHDGPCGDDDEDGDGVPEEDDVCPAEDATDHDLYTDGCVDTIYDFSPFIRTLSISRRSAETALTAVADSAALSAARGHPLVAALKLRALENLATALNRVAFITDDQHGNIIRFSDDIGDDV
jgi:hypothetical protein